MKSISCDRGFNLEFKPQQIRNICILAHVDHGKTTLVDSLIASNEIISQRHAGKLRYMDSRKDEQERGITMKSSSIALQHSFDGKDILVNVIDSPGHVDFYGEVSAALRLCDGAIILVDVVEGVCPQTIVALRQAWSEHIKPVLVINKIDRLIMERKLTALDSFIHIQQVLEQVNAVMGELFTSGVLEKNASEDSKKKVSNENLHTEPSFDWSSGVEETDDSNLYFSPEQGNVIFASASDGWGFGIAEFASIYNKKLGINKDLLSKTLWGDFYLNSKTKKIVPGAQAKSKKPIFVQLILDNIWAVYDAILVKRDKEIVNKIVKSLGLKIMARDLNHSDSKIQLQAVCGKWLPLASATLEMVCKVIPSPSELSEDRVKSLICSTTHSFESLPTETQELKKDFLACSDSQEAPIIICISKMFPVESKMLPKFKPKRLTPEEIETRREMVRKKHLEKNNAESVTDKKDMMTTLVPEMLKFTLKEETTFLAFARIFSGTLKSGKEVFVLGPKHDPRKVIYNSEVKKINPNWVLKDLGPSQHITRVKITDIYLLMGRELEQLESASPGNIIGIGGLEDHVLKTATLSTTLSCPPFVDLNVLTVPILRVALEPSVPSDMQALVSGLKLLNQADPCVQVLIQETGEHVLVTAGEVHLERCLNDLKETFAKVEINVSSPIVPFRETIILPPKTDMVNEMINSTEKSVSSKMVKNPDDITKLEQGSIEVTTLNKKSVVRLKAIPLPDSVTELLNKSMELLKLQKNLDQNQATLSVDTIKSLFDLKSKLEKCFEEAGPDWIEAVDKIWSFGPRYCGPNVLLNRTKSYCSPTVWAGLKKGTSTSSQWSEFENSFVSGFQLATLAGPLCEEPMMGVCFVIQDWNISGMDEEDLNQGVSYGPYTGQIMSAVKEGCRKAFQAQPQRLMAAMYSCTIQVTSEALGKMYAVLGRRHGRVLSSDMQEGSQRFTVTSVLPVMESFDFAKEIRKQTSGLASPQLLFNHWEVVDMDPFWVPTTEEEYAHFGEKADSENRARKYMNSVRRRKGLAVDEKIVEHAEKQRTLTRNK